MQGISSVASPLAAPAIERPAAVLSLRRQRVVKPVTVCAGVPGTVFIGGCLSMFGFLVIDKPYDVTSRDVVDHVQRLVRPARAGHAGTLDPLATGVLVVAVGRATRLIEFVQQLPKHYVGEFLLGQSSDTDDTEGKITLHAAAPVPTPESVATAITAFCGRIWQRPPAYSALKVQGQRAYALARRGTPVELAPRPVIVHRIAVVHYAYPKLTVDVTCGAGTYMRALGRDVAEAVGTWAVMSGLRRCGIGPFTLERATPMSDVTADNWRNLLIGPLAAVAHLPRITVSDADRQSLAYGRLIAGDLPAGCPYAAAVDGDDQLLAILAGKEPGWLKPHRNFLATS